jgi:pimeloyl-ACP methyl ester carboxylesterase
VQQVISPTGNTVSFDRYGSGPPLVLVHGSFTTHETNWQFIKPMLAEQFTVHAIARRGRGETDATRSHGVMDEAADVGAVLKTLDEPAFLLGHSYGAHVALAAALEYEQHIAKLILYEPPTADLPKPEELKRLKELARAGQWDQFATRFFSDTIQVPAEEIDELRNTDLWPPIVDDAPASLGDIQALNAHDFDIERVGRLKVPVMLQYGSESPPDLFLTKPLSAMLPNARVEELAGQAHEGMTTAPEQYAASVSRFLLSAN